MQCTLQGTASGRWKYQANPKAAYILSSRVVAKVPHTADEDSHNFGICPTAYTICSARCCSLQIEGAAWSHDLPHGTRYHCHLIRHARQNVTSCRQDAEVPNCDTASLCMACAVNTGVCWCTDTWCSHYALASFLASVELCNYLYSLPFKV